MSSRLDREAHFEKVYGEGDWPSANKFAAAAKSNRKHALEWYKKRRA